MMYEIDDILDGLVQTFNNQEDFDDCVSSSNHDKVVGQYNGSGQYLVYHSFSDLYCYLMILSKEEAFNKLYEVAEKIQGLLEQLGYNCNFEYNQ